MSSTRFTLRSLLLIVCAGIVGVGQSAVLTAAPATSSGVEVPASCPVSAPSQTPLVAPAPYPAQAPYPNRAWVGTPALWAMASADGTWTGASVAAADGVAYRNKLFWWRPGYDGRVEPIPALTVTGRRLDGDTPPFAASRATNAHHPDFGGWTMLTMLDIPSGCWELTGRYGADSVSFVVWVAP